jgi:ATP-dependent RNA helicase RhlE
MTFHSLGLIDPIQEALAKEGYVTPTPIQQKAIPVVLKGRDILACAQTGTGKTAAFVLPILQHITETPGQKQKHIKALILTPTRELAIQIEDNIKAYSRFLKVSYLSIYGGVNQSKQVHALTSGVDILVATPGRLLDLVGQGYIRLDKISFFVLDEADRMLDMGFVNDIKRVIRLLPPRRQSLFFSATMPDNIKYLAGEILTNPEKVEVTPVSSTAEKIDQEVYLVDQGNKNDLLVQLLQKSPVTAVLVFTRTKHGADKVVKVLNRSGIKAEAIHGNKSQNARQTALNNFKSGKTRVLVATDIAARGIDIDELSLVINFELPNVAETYVHRIGRTGRAGLSGKAISFCNLEERAYLKDIQKLIRMDISVVEGHDFPSTEVMVQAPSKAQNQSSGRPRGHQSKQGGPKPEAERKPYFQGNVKSSGLKKKKVRVVS